MHATRVMWGSSSWSQLQHGLVAVRSLVHVYVRGGVAGWPCACVAALGSSLRRSPHRQLELAMVVGWAKMTTTEASLAERWYREHAAPSEIAKRLGRSKSTITRHAIKKLPHRAQGRPPALTEAQVDYLVVSLDKMIRARKAESVVTASMLRHSTRTKARTRVIRKALAKRNIRFRPLREKPVLTEEDVSGCRVRWVRE